MLQLMFPSLFDLGVVSLNFSDVVVSKSPVNPMGCAVIKARKPIEWLLDHCARIGLDCTWIDSVVIKDNTDGSLSVIDPVIAS